jgi:hypothetical protein
MSLVLMEDLKRPVKRRAAVITSFRIFRPVLQIARYTYRSSRFLIRKTVWVIVGTRAAKQLPSPEAVKETAPL